MVRKISINILVDDNYDSDDNDDNEETEIDILTYRQLCGMSSCSLSLWGRPHKSLHFYSVNQTYNIGEYMSANSEKGKS